MPATCVRLIIATSFAFAIALVSVTPGQAQDDVRARGDKACKTSSQKLCSKFFGQGDMAVLSCLQQNKLKLAGSCRKFLTEIGQLN